LVEAHNEQGFVFRLTDGERHAKRFKLSYCVVSDTYRRAAGSWDKDSSSPNSFSSQSNGWASCVACSSAGLARKEELDWRMVYVARKEKDWTVPACGSSAQERSNGTAFVSWGFSWTTPDDANDDGEKSSPPKLTLKRARLRFVAKAYDSGKVVLNLCVGDQCSVLAEFTSTATLPIVERSEFEFDMTSQLVEAAANDFTLTARLSGGAGPVGWQQAQLFRSSLDRGGGCDIEGECGYLAYPFEVELEFE
jgi:hypothetical protein